MHFLTETHYKLNIFKSRRPTFKCIFLHVSPTLFGCFTLLVFLVSVVFFVSFCSLRLHSCPEEIKSRAYISLVRPTLEYASAVWDPYRQYQIQWLENVQRRAARFVTRTYGSDQGCVTRALNHLQWQSLQYRRKVARLTLLHNCF